MKLFGVFLSASAIGLAGVLVVLAPVSDSAHAPAVVGAAVSAPGGFTSLAPARLLDTRVGVGAATVLGQPSVGSLPC
jgi:hypothetical protein